MECRYWHLRMFGDNKMIIDGIETYLSNDTGFIEAYIRADSEMDWLIGALYYGVMVERGEDIVPNLGLSIAELGEIGGKLHYNIRMIPSTPARWKDMGKAWTNLGSTDEVIHAEEKALVLENVALIDPTTIKSLSLSFL